MSIVIGVVFYALVFLLVTGIGLMIFIDLMRNYNSIKNKSKIAKIVDTGKKVRYSQNVKFNK